MTTMPPPSRGEAVSLTILRIKVRMDGMNAETRKRAERTIEALRWGKAWDKVKFQ